MRNSNWEYAAMALFLVICLMVGLTLGVYAAPRPAIGYVRFEGTLDLASADYLVDLLDAARTDDRIAGVVLEITSPGGLATSSESVFYSLLKLREQKPVVVVVDGLALSGGYYVAAAANRIYMPASAYVGNIGTRGTRPTDPMITPDELSSGPYKITGGNRFDRIRQLDLVKEAFVKNVVHQRRFADLNPLSISEATVAEGRIYLGSEAVSVGLADREGARSDAILGVVELAQLRGYDLVELPDYFDMAPPALALPLEQAVDSLFASAPADAVYLLDSRIPLPSSMQDNEIESHLWELRRIAPATLPSLKGLSHPSETTTVPQPTGGE